jgi:hypothetical protein
VRREECPVSQDRSVVDRRTKWCANPSRFPLGGIRPTPETPSPILVRFHSRVPRNYFCLPLTSPIFAFMISPIPGTWRRRPLLLHVDQPLYHFVVLSISSISSRVGKPTSASFEASTRSVLPDLIYLIFKGVSKYLEEIVARIDTARLNHLYIDQI